MSRDLDPGIQSTVMRTAILGADLRHIDAPYYTTNFHLVLNPEKVRTPTDLVGQAIGVGSRGGAADISARPILASLGQIRSPWSTSTWVWGA